MADELKPCPLNCDKDNHATIEGEEYGGSAGGCWKVFCGWCGIGFSSHYGTRQSAIDRWNRRLLPPAFYAMMEALNGVLQVADRATAEFDSARVAILAAKAEVKRLKAAA